MICKAAEIEAPTLYYFFESKKGLFLAIRNALEEEYRKQVLELELESEKTPEEALKKYYEFCIHYATYNNDKTRFSLRLHLFKPLELKEEIEERVEMTIDWKKQLCGRYIEACFISKGSDFSFDVAFRKYSNFIDNMAFNIIFSNWCPTEKEIYKAWDLFYNNYLMD